MKRILTGILTLIPVLGLCSCGELTEDASFLDRLGYAGGVTLQGMGMIFAVLALLWGILGLFRVLMQRGQKKQTKKTDADVPAPAPAAKTEAPENDDGELVAVITAAVSAYLSSEEGGNYSGGFRVVSFKRTGTGSVWNKK